MLHRDMNQGERGVDYNAHRQKILSLFLLLLGQNGQVTSGDWNNKKQKKVSRALFLYHQLSLERYDCVFLIQCHSR